MAKATVATETDTTIKAIDPGNHEVKYFDGITARKFPSALGEARERRLENQLGDYDFIYEFKGHQGFAGTLANESVSSSSKNISKVHDEALLRILLALHQFSDDDEHKIIVGQPIETHTQDEKKKYKDMVEGTHTLTVNGKTKKIVIRRCEIAAEGVAVGLLPPVVNHGIVRVIDIGSGTVNLGSIKDLRFRDLESKTYPKGMETIQQSNASFAKLITNFALDMCSWDKEDRVRVCGGGAKALFEHLKESFPQAELQQDPTYSNVKAFYELARKIYG